MVAGHGMKKELREVIGFCCSERGLYPLAYELFLIYLQSKPEPEEVLDEVLKFDCVKIVIVTVITLSNCLCIYILSVKFFFTF